MTVQICVEQADAIKYIDETAAGPSPLPLDPDPPDRLETEAAAPLAESKAPEDQVFEVKPAASEIDPTKHRLRLSLRKEVFSENADEVKRLFAENGLKIFDKLRAELLEICIGQAKNIEVFKVLLEAGELACYAVLPQVFYYDWVEGARAALDIGASVSAKNKDGNTALHYVAKYFGRYEYKDIFEKVIEIAKSTGDLDYLDEKGVTPLGVAIQENNLEAVKALLKEGASIDIVTLNNDSALHVAAQRPIILEYLMRRNKIEMDFPINNDGYTPLHMAVRFKQLKSFELIADEFEDEFYKNTKKTNKSCLHLAVEYESFEIVEAIFGILKKEGYSNYTHLTSQVDRVGNTPFQAALQGKNNDIVQRFLRHGAAVLSDKDNNGKTALEIIANTFNDSTDLFLNVFDDHISTNSNEIDYNFFTNDQSTNQIDVITKFIEYDHSDILLHPLIKSFVYIKWNCYLGLFNFMIAIHAIFFITFNISVVGVFYYRDIHKQTTNDTNDTVLAYQASTDEVSYGWLNLPLICVYIFFLFLIIMEYTLFKKLDCFTVVRPGCLVLVIIVVGVLHGAEPANWQRHFACVALLLGWLQAMMFLSGFPDWGIYVTMLTSVVIRILKILASMIFLIIPFSICFMVQYRSERPFNGPLLAILKTLVMMSSEFEYEGLFEPQTHKMMSFELVEGSSLIMVYLLFGLFVIFVSIALMNLMIGVAVNDINELISQAEKRRLEKQVQLLGTLEKDSFLLNKIKKYFKVTRVKYIEKFKISEKWEVVNRETLFLVQPCRKLRADILNTEAAKKQREKNNIVHTMKQVDEVHDVLFNKARAVGRLGSRDK